MNLLLYSPAFAPSVGGLESVVAMLAEGFARAGHRVTVVTTTPADGPDRSAASDREGSALYRVVRNPGPLRLLRLVHRCDVFFQANVSLKGLWPLLLLRRPWVVSHHSWYCQSDGRITWRDRLKRRLLRRAAASIAVSRAVADDLDTPSVVIENPYRDDLFRRLPEIPRDRELVFLGRLVSDKGCDLLLEALGRLDARGVRPRLTLVGTGPEEAPLRRRITALGLDDRVELAGRAGGEALVRVLNRHRVLVAPSRYNEPFGIVALEGLACGCLAVGSAGGGLADAIGPGGWVFPNGDVDALADLLEAVLDGRLAPPAPEVVAGHLARHTRTVVSGRYLEVLRQVVGESAPPGRPERTSEDSVPPSAP